MPSFKNVSLLAVILVGFTFGPLNSHANCVDDLTSSAREIERVTRTSLQDVHRVTFTNNDETLVYALLRYGLSQKLFVRFARRFALDLRSDLELQTIDQAPTKVRIWRRGLALLGLNNIASREAYGFAVPRTRALGQAGRTMAFRALLSFAPVYVLLPILARLKVLGPLAGTEEFVSALSIDPVMEQLAADWRVDVAEATSRLRAIVCSVADKAHSTPAARLWRAGRLAMPLGLGLFGFLGDLPTPFAITNKLLAQTFPAEFGLYLDVDYLRDVERQIVSLRTGRVLIVYPQNLHWKSGGPKNPARALPSLNSLSAKRITYRAVESTEDLAQIDLSNFDNVILLGHGAPNWFNLGFTNNAHSRLRQGANLIYISCSIGRGGGGKATEDWIKFADSILDEGRAIAATQDIYFYPENQGAVANDIGPLDLVARPTWSPNFYDHFYGSEIIKVIVRVIQSREESYSLMPHGIRVYDSQTGQDEYFMTDLKD